MNNMDTIYKLWVTFFYGNEQNYLTWLADIKAKIEAYNLPSWLLEIINALPYIATLLSFVFVIYIFYLLIIFFKNLINVVEDPSTDTEDYIKRDTTTTDKVKTYYYFSKKPGRKKRRF